MIAEMPKPFVYNSATAFHIVQRKRFAAHRNFGCGVLDGKMSIVRRHPEAVELGLRLHFSITTH